MRPITITPALQVAYATHTGAITRARREYADHPIAYADDPLCARCQTKPRHGTFRNCRTHTQKANRKEPQWPAA